MLPTQSVDSYSKVQQNPAQPPDNIRSQVFELLNDIDNIIYRDNSGRSDTQTMQANNLSNKDTQKIDHLFAGKEIGGLKGDNLKRQVFSGFFIPLRTKVIQTESHFSISYVVMRISPQSSMC